MGARWEDAVDLNANAPPFDYNPSAWRQRVPIVLLAAAGMLISSYLAVFQLDLIGSVWDPIFGDGSEKVIDSDVSHQMERWLHIFDGAFGAWAYFTELVLGLAGSTRRWQYRPWMVLVFGIDVIPLGGVSAILVLTQGFVVGSWCTLCLVSAAISFLLIYFAYDEVWACLKYLRRFHKKTRSWRALWDVFIGRPHPDADAVALERS